MKKNNIYFTFITILTLVVILSACTKTRSDSSREFNSTYKGDYLNRIAFPMGGIGAGMLCLEGNGSFSHVSVRNKPSIFYTPFMFAAISVKGYENGAKILEGPVQNWKIFGNPNTGNGSHVFGCPRFNEASFDTHFPFGTIHLKDENIPLDISLTGWSPFIPGNADNSSLPVAAVEYTFKNTSGKELESVFSFNSENFMRMEAPSEWGGKFAGKDSVMSMNKGFVLEQSCFPDKPEFKGEFAIFTDNPDAVVDYCWFRGGWFDSKTILWKDISECKMPANPVSKGSSGASLYIPIKLKVGEEKTIKLMMSWYVPHSDLRVGWSPEDDAFNKKLTQSTCSKSSGCCSSDITSGYYEPWYSGKFKNITEVSQYWRANYAKLHNESEQFSNTLYNSDIPPVVIEAVAANLTILKSPTILRQKNGKLWAWEGCHDASGCCAGSCTHVWNYAQSISRLFPDLERTLRETEFFVDQNIEGHQKFRANLPIRSTDHSWHAAADGQLGGIMKMYREWRISGDTEWMKKFWPQVKASMDYCIREWDPKHTGTLEEPHHNTYDIEFWGPDGMCTSFYLEALNAAIKMGKVMNENIDLYKELLQKGKTFMESDLYEGEYFNQKIKWEGLEASSPLEVKSFGGKYSDEALALLKKEGPKYQYGTGCLSDGVLGSWIARMSGLNDILDQNKVKSHLLAVYKYNFKPDLSNHVNPQRAGYAYGKEGGLILCSWPKGSELTLPFVYSNEVWTGIEYQVASHLMMMGEVQKGLDIVEAVRQRYDGKIRNPFNEYECGHWYARAMSSYGLLQGLTGTFFDAVDNTMYIDSKIGDNFKCFFACETGYGYVGLKSGKPFTEVVSGDIPVKTYNVSGKEMKK